MTIEYSDPNAEEPESALAIRNPWCGYEAMIIAIQKLSIRQR